MSRREQAQLLRQQAAAIQESAARADRTTPAVKEEQARAKAMLAEADRLDPPLASPCIQLPRPVVNTKSRAECRAKALHMIDQLGKRALAQRQH